MTLLVLLVSIAVLEYVMRRPDPAPPRAPEPSGNQEVKTGEPSMAPALAQLGRVVEEFGRGPVPQPGPQPKPETTPEPTAERKG